MKRQLITLMLFCWLLPVWAADTLHTFELQHRTPAEVLPEIQLLLPEDAAISSFDNTLILRSDATTYENVRRMLDVLDKAQHSIVINVLRTQEEVLEQQGRGDRLEIDTDSVGAEINHWSTRGSRDRVLELQVHGLANEPIQINMGQLIAKREQLVLYAARGAVAVQNNTQYVRIDNGFQALVSVLADSKLRIELYTSFAEFDRHYSDVSSSSILTTVNAHAGDWLLIGQIGDSDVLNSQTRYKSHPEQQEFIYLKVDFK